MYPNKYVSKLIEASISEENLTSNFYSDLSDNALDLEDKRILKEISMDEMKHSKMLDELFRNINGCAPVITEKEMPELEKDILNNIAEAIQAEADTVERYRSLLFAFDKAECKNIIMEIIFDEQNHCAKLNYLYSKNKGSGE